MVLIGIFFAFQHKQIIFSNKQLQYQYFFIILHYKPMVFWQQIHTLIVYSSVLPSSKVQATFKQENSQKPTHNESVYQPTQNSHNYDSKRTIQQRTSILR